MGENESWKWKWENVLQNLLITASCYLLLWPVYNYEICLLFIEMNKKKSLKNLQLKNHKI